MASRGRCKAYDDNGNPIGRGCVFGDRCKYSHPNHPDWGAGSSFRGFNRSFSSFPESGNGGGSSSMTHGKEGSYDVGGWGEVAPVGGQGAVDMITTGGWGDTATTTAGGWESQSVPHSSGAGRQDSSSSAPRLTGRRDSLVAAPMAGRGDAPPAVSSTRHRRGSSAMGNSAGGWASAPMYTVEEHERSPITGSTTSGGIRGGRAEFASTVGSDRQPVRQNQQSSLVKVRDDDPKLADHTLEDLLIPIIRNGAQAMEHRMDYNIADKRIHHLAQLKESFPLYQIGTSETNETNKVLHKLERERRTHEDNLNRKIAALRRLITNMFEGYWRVPEEFLSDLTRQSILTLIERYSSSLSGDSTIQREKLMFMETRLGQLEEKLEATSETQMQADPNAFEERFHDLFEQINALQDKTRLLEERSQLQSNLMGRLKNQNDILAAENHALKAEIQSLRDVNQNVKEWKEKHEVAIDDIPALGAIADVHAELIWELDRRLNELDPDHIQCVYRQDITAVAKAFANHLRKVKLDLAQLGAPQTLDR